LPISAFQVLRLFAGVETKFIFDVWGDTVNMASRMESHGTPVEQRLLLTFLSAR